MKFIEKLKKKNKYKKNNKKIKLCINKKFVNKYK